MIKSSIIGNWMLAALFFFGGAVLQAAELQPAGNPSAARDQSPFSPLLIEPKKAEGQVNIIRFRDMAERVEFHLEADCATRLTLRPGVFPVKAGNHYWINSSFFAPFVIKAEKDGELRFELGKTIYCVMAIEPCGGENLLANASFEDAENGLPKGWQASISEKKLPVMNWGHEDLDDTLAESETKPAENGDKAIVNEGLARTGKRSLGMDKQSLRASLICESVATMPVEAGKDYLLSAYYNLDDPSFGSYAHLLVLLRAKDKPEKEVRARTLTPLICTGKTEWRRVSVRFTVPEDYRDAEPVVSVRIETRGAPSRINWDDLDLRLASAKLIQLPKQQTAETRTPRYTPDEVARFMKTRAPYDVKVVNRNGQPILAIDGQPTPIFGFTSGPYMWPQNGAHKMFGDAGVHLHWIPVYLGQTGRNKQYGPQLWLGDGKYDFSPVEEKLKKMLGYDPEAKILFYLSVNPYPGFCEKHTEAAWLNQNGKRTIGEKSAGKESDTREPREEFNFAYSAEDYRREGAAALEALGKYLASIDAGKAVIGAHLVCGSDGQWFTHLWPEHYDRSEGNRKSFGKWLRRKYGEVGKLREAWGDPAVTFETAQLPTEAERAAAGFFFDPQNGAHCSIIDANRFNSIGVAETINLFGKAFKKGIARGAIVTTYYHDAMHAQGGNHGALLELLEDDGLDGIISVASYANWRLNGRTGDYNSLIASLRLHNKLYISELDYRTSYAWMPDDALDWRARNGVENDEEGFAHQLRRSLGMCLAQGEGAWLYALGGNPWINEKFMACISEANKAAEWMAKEPLPNDRGQIAVFLDERLEDYASKKMLKFYPFNACLSMVSYNLARLPLNRSGLTWDPYLLDDVDNSNRPPYKINIFLSAPTISPEKIAWVKNNLQKDGNVVVFVNAAGYACGKGFTNNIRELTGITVKADWDKKVLYRYSPNPPDNPLAKTLRHIVSETQGPLLYVDDEAATPLAKYETEDRVAAAIREFPDWTSVYTALPAGFSPSFLRQLAKKANIEPIGPEGDATYAGNGFIVLHALTPGEKTVRWTGPADLFDLAEGRVVAENATSYTFTMEARTTRWFRRMPK